MCVLETAISLTRVLGGRGTGLRLMEESYTFMWYTTDRGGRDDLHTGEKVDALD